MKKIIALLFVAASAICLSACNTPKVEVTDTGENVDIKVTISTEDVELTEADASIFEQNGFSLVVNEQEAIIGKSLEKTSLTSGISQAEQTLKGLISQCCPEVDIAAYSLNYKTNYSGFIFSGIYNDILSFISFPSEILSIPIKITSPGIISVNDRNGIDEMTGELKTGSENVLTFGQTKLFSAGTITTTINSDDSVASEYALDFIEPIDKKMAEASITAAGGHVVSISDRRITFTLGYTSVTSFSKVHAIELYNMFGIVATVDCSQNGIYDSSGNFKIRVLSGDSSELLYKIKIPGDVIAGDSNNASIADNSISMSLTEGNTIDISYNSLDISKLLITAVIIIIFVFVSAIVVFVVKKKRSE